MRLKYVIPAVLFAALAVVFAFGLGRDPSLLPSALINKPAPEFNLPPIPGRTKDAKPGLKTADLIGQVSLVNVFASWCVACREEHPILMGLSKEGVVPLFGIDYKDKPKKVIQWLDTLGDPFTRIGADIDGRTGINWGVYGVPETFIIDREGRIRHKHVGAITEKDLKETILPIVRKLQK